MINSYLNQILNGDSIELMQRLPDNSIDIIFADPPYNLQFNRTTHTLTRPQGELIEGVNDQWDYFSSLEEYDDFTENWLSECRRILKPAGTIWISGTYHNIFRIGKLLQDLAFHILNDIIWVKNNPIPNLLARRFCAAHETLIWAVKEQGANFTFHYQSMKSLNGEAQMRSDWHLPICQGKERVTINGKKAHSTQKPEALLYRIILSSSNEGDVILDPFFGTGTTGAVAKQLGRHYIGIEQNEQYCLLAEERIRKVKPLRAEELKAVENKKDKEISFGSLLEQKMLQTGTFLYSSCGKKKARILPNGTLRFKRKTGSIHFISILASGMEGASGWNYWHFKIAHELYPIDILRDIYALIYQSKSTRISTKTYPIYLYKLSKLGGFLSSEELKKLKELILTEYEHLSQKERRIYASRQAEQIGWGGQSFVSEFLGMSRTTIRKGS